MVNILEFINENARTTKSNKARKIELEKWLKNKNYTDYVDTLNKMLDDPKAKLLLQDGFGGELGNTKFKFSVKDIPVSSLVPTQSEIDISKSIKHGLTKVESINKCFSNPVVINNMPVITFRSNYVIDGHHRWAECLVMNPDAKITCFNYDANISPIQMLKAVQGAIAAVMADDNNNNEKLPSGKTNDSNLYSMSDENIRKYIKDNITDDVCNRLIELIDTINSKHDVIEYLIDNINSMKADNYPEVGMPNRGEMPQTDKAGTEKGNKASAFPDKNGSALNKLANGKFDKDAIK